MEESVRALRRNVFGPGRAGWPAQLEERGRVVGVRAERWLGAESHRTLSCGKDFGLYSERHRKPLGKILSRGGACV